MREQEKRAREQKKIKKLEIEREREESGQIMDQVFKMKEQWEKDNKRLIPVDIYVTLMDKVNREVLI